MNKIIYLDHAATTATDPLVVNEMLPYFSEKFGNPSSVYQLGADNKIVLDKARRQIASSINASPSCIYFTAGGSESDNWALIEAARALKHKGNHIITTKIEHHAILHTAEFLENEGFEVTYLPVDEYGQIRISDLTNAINERTILISVMFANNEIGTIQPIKEIGNIARERGIIFHTDAVQAVCQVPIDVKEMNISMLSASAHKFNGPKGIGFLYVERGLSIGSFIHGGHQERGKRAGTENVPGIVGMAKACELSMAKLSSKMKKEAELRNYMLDRLLNEIPLTRLNGSKTDRLPNNINLSFQFVDGESLLIMLDLKGICCSTGSACTSGSTEPSHVLSAIGLPEDISRSSIRITLGDENTLEEIDYVCDTLKETVKNLREMSPFADEFKGMF